MIRFALVVVLFAVVVGVIWWDRAEKAKKRQLFFSLYNKALSNTKDKDKLWGVTINILDIIDETDIGPNLMHTMLKEMERLEFITMKTNTAKLTQEGVAYFKFKYLSEG
jgi:hypothetical protein